jgi:hypothetical protein
MEGKMQKQVMEIVGGAPVQTDLMSRIVNAAAAKAEFADIGKLVEVFHEMKKAAMASGDLYLQDLLS